MSSNYFIIEIERKIDHKIFIFWDKTTTWEYEFQTSISGTTDASENDRFVGSSSLGAQTQTRLGTYFCNISVQMYLKSRVMVEFYIWGHRLGHIIIVSGVRNCIAAPFTIVYWLSKDDIDC